MGIAACAAALLATPAAAEAKVKLTPVDGFGFEGDSGTRKLDFTVVLSHSRSKSVRVDYATAAAGVHPADPISDYTDVSGTLTIKRGRTSGTIAVPVKGDLSDEYAETLKLDLSHPHGARLAHPTATGFILDDDRPPTASIQGTPHLEATNAVFHVTLSQPSGKDGVFVSAQTDAPHAINAFTAQPLSDYTPADPVELDFAPGVAQQDLVVPVASDASYEKNEVIIGELVNPSDRVGLATTIGFATITNDDDPPQLSIDDVSAAEGDSGPTDFTYTVTLTGATDLPASVDYATADGTATTADNDYAAASGTLNFPVGVTTQQVTVQVQGDTTVEPDEVFTVALTNPSDATLATGADTGAGTIQDDDGP